eukprot:2804413-Prymnesium_polylepis.1
MPGKNTPGVQVRAGSFRCRLPATALTIQYAASSPRCIKQISSSTTRHSDGHYDHRSPYPDNRRVSVHASSV